MFLRRNLSLVLTVSFWDDVAIDVSVEVVGEAGVDGVSDDNWSFVEWCVATGRDLSEDLHVGTFSTDGSPVVVGS